MNKEKSILQIVFLLMLFSSFLFSSPAITKTVLFTQPDGTEFEGLLKGDSSFHWIESKGRVVKMNKDDGFYYNAVVDAKKGVILTHEKPTPKVDTMSPSLKAQSIKHNIGQDEKKILLDLGKKMRVGNYPK